MCAEKCISISGTYKLTKRKSIRTKVIVCGVWPNWKILTHLHAENVGPGKDNVPAVARTK